VTAAGALAADDPWAAGCPGCSAINPPAYMAQSIAAFASAAEREGVAPGVTGPDCRTLEAGDWSICRFALRSGCASLDIAGQHGAVAVMSLGVLVTPGCPEDSARAIQRAAVHGLLRRRDGAATEAATSQLFSRALDLSTPEKLAAFEATQVSGEPLPPDIEIAALCGTMGGSRIVEPADGGTRESITINVRAE
jgi:hypothetical protein